MQAALLLFALAFGSPSDEIVAAFRTDAQASAPKWSLLIVSEEEGCWGCEMLKLETAKNPTKYPPVSFVYDEAFAAKIGVRSFPTTIIQLNGKEVERVIGYAPGVLQSRLKARGWK